MEMENSEKYESTPFHRRNMCFRAWMLKTYTRISAAETREILLFVETERGDESDDDEQIESQNTEEFSMDMEVGLEENDMEVDTLARRIYLTVRGRMKERKSGDNQRPYK